MPAIRVLIIEDSAFMRKMITDILASDSSIHVVGTARNGKDGLEKIKQRSPDVVTLDVEMPVMDGIETLERIMTIAPLPVVMLSSSTREGTQKAVRAISIGAVDVIPKPSGAISLDIETIKQEIISKVITASKAKISKHPPISRHALLSNRQQTYENSIVTIGTSTGGPRALQQVLTALPNDFPAPILIVQHMPAKFTKSLADRLNMLSHIHVKEATHGELVQKGTAYIAPGDYHMKARQAGMSLAIELTQEPSERGHRPAVNVLFESVASLRQVNKFAIVLTGMGQDGARGIQAIKKADPKAVIISESEESTVVYGMPSAAVKTGHVNQVIHLNSMGETINDLIRGRGRNQ